MTPRLAAPVMTAGSTTTTSRCTANNSSSSSSSSNNNNDSSSKKSLRVAMETQGMGRVVVCQDEKMCTKAYKMASLKAQRLGKKNSPASFLNSPEAIRADQQIPRLDCREIVLGTKLGKGGFNDVYEVSHFNLFSSSSSSSSSCHNNDGENSSSSSSSSSSNYELTLKRSAFYENMSSPQQRMAREKLVQEQQQNNNNGNSHSHHSQSHSRYAVKFLRDETMKRKSKFVTAAMDLIVEAKFLSALQHPNIIQLHGLPASDTLGFLNGTYGGYFLLVDRLSETLENRMVLWQQQRKQLSLEQQKQKVGKKGSSSSGGGGGGNNIISNLFRQHHYQKELQHQMKLFLSRRLEVARDVASAIAYLHSKNIIYRDLKLENIGFGWEADSNGRQQQRRQVVKLFDFGLAKELDPRERVCKEGYAMSGETGSLRYMSPEVALAAPYGLSADVYSFGLNLWAICALEQPFSDMNVEMHHDQVILGGQRPPMDNHHDKNATTAAAAAPPEGTTGCGWPGSLRSLLKKTWAQDRMARPPMSSVVKSLDKEIISLRGSNSSKKDSSSILMMEQQQDLVQALLKENVAAAAAASSKKAAATPSTTAAAAAAAARKPPATSRRKMDRAAKAA